MPLEASSTLATPTFLHKQRISFDLAPKEPILNREVLATQNLLALRNQKRLEALHANGNYERDSKLPTDPKKISPETAKQLIELQRQLRAIGGSDLQQAFLNTPYCLQFVEDFLDYDPKGIALAFHAREVTKNIVEQRAETDNPIDPQFIPAMNLGIFVALERLQQPDLLDLSAKDAAQKLSRSMNAQMPWSERTLIQNLTKYLENANVMNPRTTGAPRDYAVALQVADDIHKRLQYWTERRKNLGQSQGVEVEMLQWEDKSVNQRWVKEHHLENFLPRGLDPSTLARTDWMLLGILGLKEDLGERLNELFETSTAPTSTVTGQSTLLHELMLGGFIDPEQAISGNESYSLHLSTAFPAEIFNHNNQARREYVLHARALGGAFSSINRMKYGGWVTFADDGWDYEISWRDLGHQKINPIPGQALSGNELIVEIRTLDVTEKDHLSAEINKEYLDYGFRAHWEQQIGSPPRNQNDLRAAAVWQDYMTQLSELNEYYEVKDHWQGTANAREKWPEYQKELQKLIRKHAGEIRRISDQSVESFEMTGEAPYVTGKVETKMDEALDSSTVALPSFLIENLGIEEGDVYTFRVGATTRTVTITSSEESNIGFSPDVTTYIPIPENCNPRLKYDADRREIALGPVVGIAVTPTNPNSEYPFENILDWPLVDAQLAAARQVGAIVYAFDPSKFDSARRDTEAYVLTDVTPIQALSEGDRHTYTITTMPQPDIIYDWTSQDWIEGDKIELLARSRVANETSVASISHDKVTFYETMSQLDALNARMPETIQYTNPTDLQQMLDKHGFVVMKPRWGEEGQAIIYIRQDDDGNISYTSPGWKSETGHEQDEKWTVPEYTSVSTLDELLEQTEKVRQNWTMIVQQGIEMMHVPVDFDSRDVAEIRTVLYRHGDGNIAILGQKEKARFWTHRLESVVGKAKARSIVSNAQALSLLCALQTDHTLGKKAVSLLAVDVFVDKNGNIWLGESNSGPTLLWYNHPDHPDLVNRLGREQLRSFAVQTGFAPKPHSKH